MADRKKRCFQCSKAVLYIVNMLFWMLGASLLGLGIWLHLTNGTLLTISPGYTLLMPAVLFIIPGCLSIVVGFLGCCGAITENKCMIITYCVMVVILFILELAIGVAGFVGDVHLRAHMEIEKQLNLSLSERYPGENPELQHDIDIVHGWDVIQQEFECCGVDSYKDWFNSHGWPSEKRVPDSCCKNLVVGCGENENMDLWYSSGCSEPIKQFIVDHLFTVAVATLVFAGLQITTAFGAVVFLRYRKKHKQIR